MDWNWISNPWVVGIGASIPGGFLVNWLSSFVLGKRENREYLQKINGANREVVYAIRPGISEGQIPTTDVLSSLINATARRYGVEASDLYSPAQIAEELVKEVMDSSFISSAQKSEFCVKLNELRGLSKQLERKELERSPSENKTVAEYRQRLISVISMAFGLMTTVMGIAYSLYDLLKSKRMDGLFAKSNDKPLEALLPVLLALVTALAVIVLTAALRALLRSSDDADVFPASREQMNRDFRAIEMPRLSNIAIHERLRARRSNSPKPQDKT